MIVELFDRRTMAKMEAALDSICERLPHGEKHNIRERAAQGIVRCAKTGNTGLDAHSVGAKKAVDDASLQSSSMVRSGLSAER